MAEQSAIEISSSDSDSSTWDLDLYRDYENSPSREATSSANPNSSTWGLEISGTNAKEHEPLSTQSSNPRILPSWAFSTDTSSYGNLKRVFNFKKTAASNGSSSRPSGSSKNHADYVGHPSQLTSRRVLPSSLQSSAPSARSTGSTEKASSSQSHEAYGSFSNMGRSYHSNGWNYAKDSVRGNEDELLMYEINRSRVLPLSLMPGRPYSGAQYSNSLDPNYHSTIAEGKTTGTDERLIYQAALEDLHQPKGEMSVPDGLLSVSLLRHQRIALAWMVQRETRTLHCSGGILADDQGLGKTISVIALILRQRHTQLKSKPSEGTCSEKTEAFNLDDDDDINSAILDETNEQIDESGDVKLVSETSKSTSEFPQRRPSAGTLIVCPASVLRQWARELDEKVADKLEVCVHHGSSRTKDPFELSKYDVVLTTYSIVTNEVPKQPLVDEDEDDQKDWKRFGLSSEFSTNKKQKVVSGNGNKVKKNRKGHSSYSFDYDCGALGRVRWHRVVLDEAQTIKNHRTQVARACCGLKANRRWCLSGTPIQNAIDELFSYFRFLRYDPYAKYKSFCESIKFPISRNSVQGYMKLQVVLRAIMLRRTKGTIINGEPIIKLPPKTIRLEKVEFSVEEREFYDKLEAESRLQFKAYAAAGTLNQNYANILLMLLRLRQACDHPFLVKGFNASSVSRVSSDMGRKLPKNTLVKLSNLLEASLAICCLCSDPPEDAVVTICGHVFCYQCVSEYLTGDDNTCPKPGCKKQVDADVIFSKAILKKRMSDDLDGNLSSSHDVPGNLPYLRTDYCSSKIKAALGIIQSHGNPKGKGSELNLVHSNGHSSAPENGCPDSLTKGPMKALVFSQWTRMLDIFEIALEQSNIEYRRLDGTMTLSARDRAVKEFNSDPEVTVMLMSLKAGNLGLNMVAACHVILLDLWWNPTTEDQAIDRAHRIGQTRPVTVSRLTIKGTVEDRILSLQEDKRKMVASAFGEDHSGSSAARLTAEDLRYLFLGGG